MFILIAGSASQSSPAISLSPSPSLAREEKESTTATANRVSSSNVNLPTSWEAHSKVILCRPNLSILRKVDYFTGSSFMSTFENASLHSRIGHIPPLLQQSLRQDPYSFIHSLRISRISQINTARQVAFKHCPSVFSGPRSIAPRSTSKRLLFPALDV